jgi:hypothetical protein
VTPEPGGAIRGSMKNQIYRVGQYGMPIGIDERIGAFLAHVEDRP